MILHPQGRVKTFQRSLAALCLQLDSSPEMPPNWLLMRHPPGQAPRGAITDGQMTLSDLRGGPASRGEKQGPGRDNGGIRASENCRFMLALVAAGTRRERRLGRMLLRQVEDDGARRLVRLFRRPERRSREGRDTLSRPVDGRLVRPLCWARQYTPLEGPYFNCSIYPFDDITERGNIWQ